MSESLIKFVGWQICFDANFHLRRHSTGSCQWVERQADGVGESPRSKSLALEGYL